MSLNPAKIEPGEYTPLYVENNMKKRQETSLNMSSIASSFVSSTAYYCKALTLPQARRLSNEVTVRTWYCKSNARRNSYQHSQKVPTIIQYQACKNESPSGFDKRVSACEYFQLRRIRIR